MLKNEVLEPIPTFKRLCAIIQLCLAFSLLLWYAAQPFMGEYFTLRSKMLLYEYVMGVSQSDSSQPSRFQTLPADHQAYLLRDYAKLHHQAHRSTFTKIWAGLEGLLVKISLFEMSWLLFSIVICILFLLQKEGAAQAVWLLPLIILSYAVDNRLNGHSASPSSDLILFPTETAIVHDYLKEPLSSNWLIQYKQLKKGWESYLIQRWTTQQVEKDQPEWEQAVEEGLFNFTLARLEHLHLHPVQDGLGALHAKTSDFWLGFYLVWNGCLAWILSSPNNATSRLKGNSHKSDPSLVNGHSDKIANKSRNANSLDIPKKWHIFQSHKGNASSRSNH